MDRSLSPLSRTEASFRLAGVMILLMITMSFKPIAVPHAVNSNTVLAISSTVSKAANNEGDSIVTNVPDVPALEEGCTNTSPKHHFGTYRTGPLSGRAAGDLYGAYLGFQGRFSNTVTVDWDNTLAKLWDRKLERSKGNMVVREANHALVTEYHTCSSNTMSLIAYQGAAAASAQEIYDSLNWNAIGEHNFRKGEVSTRIRRLTLLKRIASNFGGRSLLAYSMTELLPSTDGKFNRNYYHFLLQNGGSRFVESLPALYDRKVSFGSFQFTEYAVYEVGNNRRGASRMNVFLPNQVRIPGSTLRLRTNDHFKAAYLFGVQNLADFIRKLNTRQLATLERIAPARGLDILQFIATAHNKPAVAVRAGMRWLDDGGRQEQFFRSCPRASSIYARKTIANWKALSATT